MLAEHFQGAGRACEADVLQSPGDRPDRDRTGVQLPGQAPVVVRLRGLGTEHDGLGLGLGPALRSRLAQVPGPDVRLEGGVGVAGLLDDVLRGLRPEASCFQFGVGVPAQLVFTRDSALERHLRHPARGLVDRAQSGAQRGGLAGLRHQLHLRHNLHTRHRMAPWHHEGTKPRHPHRPPPSRHRAAGAPLGGIKESSRTRSSRTDRHNKDAQNSGAPRLRARDAIPPGAEAPGFLARSR